MNQIQNVLVLDDEAGFRNEICEYLSDEGYRVLQAGSPSQAVELIGKHPVGIALFDIRLPEEDGLNLLKKIKQEHPLIEIIMMTGFGDMDCVIKALRYGATDFLNKPFKFTDLKDIIEKILKYRAVKTGMDSAAAHSPDNKGTGTRIIGESKPMKHIYSLIHSIASTPETTVLISGESGTGKELLARAIHNLSDRKCNRFLPVNCSSIPEELFENEFFGHAKGSYTDAKYDQKGLFELADKGTLFLDEIGDLKYSMQAKLLRVLEDKKISRIGQFSEKKVDIRIISATNQDIEQMVDNKQFRNDLYYRLNMFRIDLPPLRNRKDDIPLMVDFFVSDFSKRLNKPVLKIEKSIITKLQEYDFPGNVRELKNLVERAVIMCERDILSEKHFGILDALAKKKKEIDHLSDGSLRLNQIEKESIMKALQKCKNNKSKASQMLNISRQALDRKMKKLDIGPE